MKSARPLTLSTVHRGLTRVRPIEQPFPACTRRPARNLQERAGAACLAAPKCLTQRTSRPGAPRCTKAARVRVSRVPVARPHARTLPLKRCPDLTLPGNPRTHTAGHCAVRRLAAVPLDSVLTDGGDDLLHEAEGAAPLQPRSHDGSLLPRVGTVTNPVLETPAVVDSGPSGPHTPSTRCRVCCSSATGMEGTTVGTTVATTAPTTQKPAITQATTAIQPGPALAAKVPTPARIPRLNRSRHRGGSCRKMRSKSHSANAGDTSTAP